MVSTTLASSYIRPEDAGEGGASLSVTNATTVASSIVMRDCAAQFKFDFNIPILVICIVSFLVGLIYTFFGYRLFKVVMFLTGLIFGAVLIYLVCDKEKLLPPLGNAGVGLGAGVLFGLITMLVEYVGVFMTGFIGGLCVGVAVMLVLFFLSPPTTVWLTVGVLFGVGLLCALVTLKWERPFVLLGTGLIGAAMVVTSLDYLVEQTWMIDWMWAVLNARGPSTASLCWFSWLIFGLWPVLFLLGALVQWKLTGAGYSHKQGLRNSGGRNASSATRPLTETKVKRDKTPTRSAPPPAPARAVVSSATAAKTPPKSFRYLYQIRRQHGDVICQV